MFPRRISRGDIVSTLATWHLDAFLVVVIRVCVSVDTPALYCAPAYPCTGNVIQHRHVHVWVCLCKILALIIRLLGISTIFLSCNLHPIVPDRLLIDIYERPS